MDKKTKKQKNRRTSIPSGAEGFTLIELVLALASAAILAVISTAFLFSILSQRDQAIAEALVTSQPEIIFPLLSKAIKSAEGITIKDEGRRLETNRQGECFTFVWDQIQEAIFFGREVSLSCTPPEQTTIRLTPNTVQITNFEFQLIDPTESSLSIRLTLDVAANRPYWQTDQHFSQVFVSVMN